MVQDHNVAEKQPHEPGQLMAETVLRPQRKFRSGCRGRETKYDALHTDRLSTRTGRRRDMFRGPTSQGQTPAAQNLCG